MFPPWNYNYDTKDFQVRLTNRDKNKHCKLDSWHRKLDRQRQKDLPRQKGLATRKKERQRYRDGERRKITEILVEK